MRHDRAATGIVGQPAANAGIAGRGIAMRRGQAGGNVGPRAKTRIDQPARPKPLKRCIIRREPLGLDQHIPVPLYPQPAQILEYSIGELGPASPRVQILDPKQEAVPRRPSGNCGKGMA